MSSGVEDETHRPIRVYTTDRRPRPRPRAGPRAVRLRTAEMSLPPRGGANRIATR